MKKNLFRIARTTLILKYFEVTCITRFCSFLVSSLLKQKRPLQGYSNPDEFVNLRSNFVSKQLFKGSLLKFNFVASLLSSERYTVHRREVLNNLPAGPSASG